MKKLDKLKQLFMVVFLIFPVAITGALSLNAMISKSAVYMSGHYIWEPVANRRGTFAVAALFFFLLYLGVKKNNRIVLYIMLAGGAIFRLIIFALFSEYCVPFSDSAQVWDIANGNNASLLYKSFFPEWSNWAALQKILVKHFHLSYSDFVFGQLLCGFVIAVFIYLLAGQIVKDKMSAMAASVLYLWMPSQACYIFFVSPDIFAMTMITIAIYILVLSLDKCKSYKRFLIRWIVASVLTGVGSCYKPLGMIFVVASAIVLFWYWMDKKEKYAVLKVVFCICSICIIMSGISKINHRITEKILGIDVSDSATISYMCIGLNTQGEGQIHLGELSRTYNNLRLSGMSEEEATQETKEVLREDWTENADHIPQLLLNKTVWAWQDDLMPHYFFTKCVISQEKMSDTDKKIYSAISQYGAGICQWYYIFLMILTIVATMVGIRNYREKHAFFLCSLFVFGFSLVLLLSEAQSRYKSNILPFLCIITACGFATIKKKDKLQMR